MRGGGGDVPQMPTALVAMVLLYILFLLASVPYEYLLRFGGNLPAIRRTLTISSTLVDLPFISIMKLSYPLSIQDEAAIFDQLECSI